MSDYTLPPLPYDYGALEPHIDARTMEIHHGKHHQAYINNLNAALKDHPDHQGKPIEQLLAGLDALRRGLDEVGLEPHPTKTAILLDPDAVRARLLTFRPSTGGHVSVR